MSKYARHFPPYLHSLGIKENYHDQICSGTCWSTHDQLGTGSRNNSARNFSFHLRLHQRQGEMPTFPLTVLPSWPPFAYETPSFLRFYCCYLFRALEDVWLCHYTQKPNHSNGSIQKSQNQKIHVKFCQMWKYCSLFFFDFLRNGQNCEKINHGLCTVITH